MHVTHQFVLQTSDIPIEDWKIKTLPSCDGPFLFHCRYEWNTNKLITAILGTPPDWKTPGKLLDEDAQIILETPPYLIKLRGEEREELERRITKKQRQGDAMNWLMSCRFQPSVMSPSP